MTEQVKVIFSRNYLPGSLLIRAFTWSRWSHCAIIDGDDVIESKIPQGVIRRPLREFIKNCSEYKIVTFQVESRDAVIKAANSQLGKPYDYFAVIGMVFRRDWQDKNRWFCSEFVVYALSEGGYTVFRKERLSRVTPEHLWMVST